MQPNTSLSVFIQFVLDLKKFGAHALS